jgi:hypothetical protein
LNFHFIFYSAHMGFFPLLFVGFGAWHPNIWYLYYYF